MQFIITFKMGWCSYSLQAGRSRDRIPVVVIFSAPVQKVPVAHTDSYTMVTGLFLGVKRPWRGVGHPPSSRAEVQEKAVIPLLPLWRLACSGVTTFTSKWILFCKGRKVATFSSHAQFEQKFPRAFHSDPRF
jgi:hypothetical protein